MLFSPSRLALQVTVLAAVGLHAGVGYWLMSPSGRPGGAADAALVNTPVTLVLAPTVTTTSTQPQPPANTSQATHAIERPSARSLATPSPADPVVPAPTTPTTPVVSTQTLGSQAPQDSSSSSEAPAPAGDPDRFTAASLPGEPLIPLEDDDAAIVGSLSLRLAIDETGHVVHSEVVSRQGLTDKAVDVFVAAFSGYDYIPARRGDRAVRSEVTMVVGVEDNGSESRQP